MAEKKAEILEELVYDPQIALAVIESESDLKGVFLDVSEVKSLILLRQLVKEDKLSPDTKQFLYELFYHVIQTKQECIDKYKLLQGGGELPTVVSPETPIAVVVEPVVEKVVPKATKPKPTKEKELPRRYGKEKIQKDIEAQGGKATPLQNAMLKVNTMKNTYVNLNARLIKDMFLEHRTLTDEDYRTIDSVIVIMERKLAEILKKK